MLFRIQVALLYLLPAALPASAEVTRIEILDRQPVANGREFPGVGAYERLRGRVEFAIDPRHAANRPIVDVELAPRDAQGRVTFTTDFDMLAPVDRTQANGTLFYDVNNRGRRMCLRMFNDQADDFLMRRGYVVLWCGWLAEVLPIPDSNNPSERLLRMDVPVARTQAGPIHGLVRQEVMVNEPVPRFSISNREMIGAYRPTQQGLAEATLTWRLRERDRRVPIPRNQWRLKFTEFRSDDQPRCLPLIELELAGGLKPGYIYELIYEARDPVVQGLGLAAIRDLVSHLKYSSGQGNPLAVAGGEPAVDRAIGFGISQSGRCLRMLLYEGFNADEQGRIVFDGMIPHVAGGGLGFFNHRFAAPTRYATQHVNHLFPCDMFPFAYQTEHDPISDREDGILRRARAAKVVPKIMHIHNAAEYWNRCASLVHTDPLGKHDREIPPEVRIYAIGGAQHGWGNDLVAASAQLGQLVNNPTDYRPHLRASLVALEAWIRQGTEPPASVYPRLDNATLVNWPESDSGWRAIPGVRYPEVIQQAELLDFGPEFARHGRLTAHPPRRLVRYPVRVPAYDDDNNGKGMLRLPTLAVPVATYTGWNLRDRMIGAENEMTRLRGAMIPFARTKAQRMASGDPRPALLERYHDFDDYLSRFQAATDRLVAQRHLLAEDAPRLIRRAQQRRRLFESSDTQPAD